MMSAGISHIEANFSLCPVNRPSLPTTRMPSAVDSMAASVSASDCRRASSARWSWVRSWAMAEMPTTAPEASRIGETVRKTRMRRPSLQTRDAS